MTAWDVGTWLAALVLGPGAVIVFAAFLRDLRRLLGAPSAEASVPQHPPRSSGEGSRRA